jgi:CHASE3 domain sensor protein
MLWLHSLTTDGEFEMSDELAKRGYEVPELPKRRPTRLEMWEALHQLEFRLKCQTERLTQARADLRSAEMSSDNAKKSLAAARQELSVLQHKNQNQLISIDHWRHATIVVALQLVVIGLLVLIF